MRQPGPVGAIGGGADTLVEVGDRKQERLREQRCVAEVLGAQHRRIGCRQAGWEQQQGDQKRRHHTESHVFLGLLIVACSQVRTADPTWIAAAVGSAVRTELATTTTIRRAIRTGVTTIATPLVKAAITIDRAESKPR